jgi:hypothetical protein
MKKLLLTLIGAVALAASSHATLVFSDGFSYPDGGIVSNSAGIWVQNTGTADSMLVSNNQLVVSTSRTEDIAASLGATYATNGPIPALYASFTVKFTGRPTATGTYFTHFAGPNSNGALSGARARVWASITNVATGNLAASDKFLLSIVNASGGNATNSQWTTELTTNVTYTILVKYELATLVATMWIDPVDESSPNISGTDFPVDLYDPAGGLVNVTSYSYRQATGEGTMFIDNLKVGTTFADALGLAPLISPIPSQSTPKNTPTSPIGFTVQDGQTVASSLTVVSNSANTTLVPDANIALATVGGTGGTNRTVVITPAAGQQGKAKITLTVSDGTYASPTSFEITVGAPTISAIPNQITSINTPTAAIPFTVLDPDGDTLTLSSNSSNPTLITDANIAISGVGPNRTITLTPESGQTGISTITLTATDGFNTNSTSFIVAVSPALGLIYSDDFSYPNGPLITFPNNGTWSTTPPSGTAVIVTNQTVQISELLTEDVNTGAGFTGAPFTPASGVVLYSGFTFSMAKLPSSSGEYFAHFKDTGNFFKAKIFAGTANAAPGYFRIGIANAANSVSAQVANDLATNTTYLVVTRYNVATAESVIWVNPTSALSVGAVATDLTVTDPISQYGLRQTANEGILYLDNLKIGTSLADVATIPTLTQTLTNAVLNGELVLSWGTSLPNSLFALQSASAVTGPYSTIPGATSPYTNSPSATQKYFRLKY